MSAGDLPPAPGDPPDPDDPDDPPHRTDPAPDALELAPPAGAASRARRVALATAAAMLVPPLIAAIAGGLGLAIAVGVLSIFGALLGLAALAYRGEVAPRPLPPPLPRARLAQRGRRGSTRTS